ncbi:MAG: carbohydrate ABC transporter permease, partial [Bifidobacteriales bacterium]|nr:carbohydrate ABC transporter permease [Bifidobacteriales bacterium]
MSQTQQIESSPKPRPSSRPRRRSAVKDRLRNINWWLTAVVAVFSLTILVPLYFTVVTALKTPAEAGTFSLPTSWQWHNFADAW